MPSGLQMDMTVTTTTQSCQRALVAHNSRVSSQRQTLSGGPSELVSRIRTQLVRARALIRRCPTVHHHQPLSVLVFTITSRRHQQWCGLQQATRSRARPPPFNRTSFWSRRSLRVQTGADSGPFFVVQPPRS